MFRSAAAVQKRCLSSWALSKQLVKRRIICFGTSALLLALLSGNAGAQFEIPDIHFKKTPDRTRDREPPTGDVHRTGPSKEQIEQREKERRQHAEELRRRKAQKLYDDGTELYKQGDYEGAAEKFAAAHDLNPSNEEISRKLSAATHLRQIEIQTENEREAFKQRAGEIREEMRKRLEEFKEIARDETKEELAKKGDKALKDILDRICGDLCAEATMDIRDIQKQASRNVEDVLNALPQAVGQMGSGSTDDSAIQRVVDIANEDANKIKEKDVSIWVKWLKKLGFREKEK